MIVPDPAPRHRLICVILALACGSTIVPATAPETAGSDTGAEPTSLFGDAYPVEVSVSFHKAFLHWLDSLAMLTGRGLTGGKTIDAHRREFERLFGTPSPKDGSMLKRYRAVRLGDAQRTDAEDRDRVTLAFLEASSLDEALERAGELLDTNPARALATAMRHFEPRYRRIWRDGEVPRAFLARAQESDRRAELGGLLVQVARFYGVSPGQDPRPEIVFVPVPRGHGTHAQAVGSFLLIEIRLGESLIDEVAPIVHENAHFLFRKIPPSRQDQLEQAALRAQPSGADAWLLLKEALPTAIAQGVADRSFRRETWSKDQPWYHADAVDAYAKRIFPLVDEALNDGGTLDPAFVEKLVAAFE
jgi:hypothetical protein